MSALTDERQQIIRLNEQIAVMQQQRDVDATAWFRNVLPDQLVFRRVTGTVIDKQVFLKSLGEPNPFTSRKAEEIKSGKKGTGYFKIASGNGVKTSGKVRKEKGGRESHMVRERL